MPRPRSAAVALVKEKLIARLRQGGHPPGQRFFSNRALAEHFGLSYQTAHRLNAELEREGWLERRQASGTYVAGTWRPLQGVELVFHARARREGSFGARLLQGLQAELEAASVPVRVVWAGETSPQPDWLPVVWEVPEQAAEAARERRFSVMLNDQPPPGIAASYIDSVSTDDFSGGVVAGELLRPVAPARSLAILAGPRDDPRCRRRVEGFQSQVRKAEVVWAGGWFTEDACRVAPRLVRRGYAGLFCCNDRLAEALLAAYDGAGVARPAVVGFDDAPVAEDLHLTTVAIPWKELILGAVDIVRQRLRGATGPAANRVYSPRPVIRTTLPLRGDMRSGRGRNGVRGTPFGARE
ncbi:MAG: substrate-binding domain-containing protein [Opitutaceae bacterium]